MTACVRGRIEFVEKSTVTRSSATRSSRKVVPRRRMAELEEFIQCLSDMKTADIARSSKGRIAELQTALSELAASQVAMTEAE